MPGRRFATEHTEGTEKREKSEGVYRYALRLICRSVGVLTMRDTEPHESCPVLSLLAFLSVASVCSVAKMPLISFYWFGGYHVMRSWDEVVRLNLVTVRLGLIETIARPCQTGRSPG